MRLFKPWGFIDEKCFVFTLTWLCSFIAIGINSVAPVHRHPKLKYWAEKDALLLVSSFSTSWLLLFHTACLSFCVLHSSGLDLGLMENRQESRQLNTSTEVMRGMQCPFAERKSSVNLANISLSATESKASRS